MTGHLSIVPKITRLVPLLGSDQSGEVVAAAAAIGRALRSDGLDWHRPEERRRGPVIKYAPLACPNVKPYLNAEWSKPNIGPSMR